LENILTKDYEKFMEYLSYEDYYAEKMVSLQNPYFYISNSMKTKKPNDIINRYNKSKEVISLI
jgi:hypothetical protein